MQTEHIKPCVITPSNTPLKRYSLLCPKCEEDEIVFPSEKPDKPYCRECDEEIDIDSLIEFITNWIDYLKDRSALLQNETITPIEESR